MTATARPTDAVEHDTGPWWRSTGLLLFLLGGAATWVWGLMGASLLTDDFTVATWLSERGLADGMRRLSFEQPARPLTGPYYALLYEVIGDRPMLQAGVLGALNGLATWALWRGARVMTPRRVAFYAALVFAVVPNHASIRFWFVVGNYALAVALVMLAASILFRRDRPAVVALLFVAAVFLYEAVFGLIVGVVLCWILADQLTIASGRTALERLRSAALPAAAAVAATGLVYVLSPKRTAPVEGGGVLEPTLLDGLLGAGLTGHAALGMFSLVVIGLAMLWAGAISFFPTYRGLVPADLTGALRVGAILFVTAVAPLNHVGLKFAVAGIFDRNNLVPSVGICIMIGALLVLLERHSRTLGAAALCALITWFAVASLQDLSDYRDAAADGRALIDQLRTDVPLDDHVVVVRPFLDRGRGVEMFIYPDELGRALRLEGAPTWPRVVMPRTDAECVAISAELEASDTPAVTYDRLARTVVPHDPSTACEAVSRPGPR